MDYERQLMRIISIIKDGRANNVTPEEICMGIKEIIPPEQIIITPEPKTSPEKLQYLKEYRELQKKYKVLARQQNSKQAIRQKRIDKSLKRTSFFCFACKEAIKCNPEKNNHEFVIKRGQPQRKLIIKNVCGLCSGEVKAFGGYFDGY